MSHVIGVAAGVDRRDHLRSADHGAGRRPKADAEL
jgi:hypothetical protein